MSKIKYNKQNDTNSIYTVNGRVRMIPFTGERIKAKLGLTTKTYYNFDEDKPFSNTKLENYYIPINELYRTKINEDSNYFASTVTSNPVMTTPIIYTKPSKSTFKTFLNNNFNDLIAGGANAIGSLTGYLANRNAINRMNDPREPIPIMASKLKTKININHQLNKIRESLANIKRDTNVNTQSSAVAQNRINASRLSTANMINELYGNKENAETELINKDLLNKQQVRAANIEQYNNYLNTLVNHRNKIAELKSENLNNFINGLNTSIQNVLTNREKRNQFNNSLIASIAANPNAAKLFMNLPINGLSPTIKQMINFYNKGRE